MAGLGRASAAVAALAAAALLGACATPADGPLASSPGRDPALERAEACRAAGYPEGSDALRLCLRVAELEARVERLETQISRLELLGPYPFYGPFGPFRGW